MQTLKVGKTVLDRDSPISHRCYSIVTVERIISNELVNIKNIKAMNQTQPVFNVIVTPCSVSLAIRQSP